jgi:signal recognition particle subunit SRP54
MFDSLSEKLGGILDRLTRRGALSEADVDFALREVRRALLEADVALDVARSFTEGVKKQAVGVEVMKSVTPGQMVVKIVHDQLVAMRKSTRCLWSTGRRRHKLRGAQSRPQNLAATTW